MVLVTGFVPFAGDNVNPSEILAKEMSGSEVEGHRITSLILPVDTLKVNQLLVGAVEELRPSVVIALGYAGGRTCINLERLAINTLDFAIPDSAGVKPVGLPVVKGGPAAYEATIPIYQIQQQLRSAGIPCLISNSAGTYLCNQVMYHILHSNALGDGKLRAGFIHVPALPYMDKAIWGRIPSMSLDLMAKGIEIAVKTTLEVSI